METVGVVGMCALCACAAAKWSDDDLFCRRAKSHSRGSGGQSIRGKRQVEQRPAKRQTRRGRSKVE